MNPRTLYLIKRAEIEVTSRLQKALDTYDITPSQFTVLYFVDFYKGNLSSAQLSRRFSMKPQSMSQLVGVLERKKLMKKFANPEHARILHLRLTKKGRALLEDCNAVLDHIEDTLLDNLSEVEQHTFRRLLGKIINTSQLANTADTLYNYISAKTI